MATWIVKLGDKYVCSNGLVAPEAQSLAMRHPTRAQAFNVMRAWFNTKGEQPRIVRLRTREEKRIAELEAALVIRGEAV